MIINKLSTLKAYNGVFRHLSEVVHYIEKNDIKSVKEGTTDISENFYIVKIVGELKPTFDEILEVHQEWIDIHIPLTSNDKIAFKSIQECKNLHKEYVSENDYALYNESNFGMIDIPLDYFCIIDTDMAHMAMLGNGPIEKLVIKIKK